MYIFNVKSGKIHISNRRNSCKGSNMLVVVEDRGLAKVVVSDHEMGNLSLWSNIGRDRRP